jgi:hypothetical protein
MRLACMRIALMEPYSWAAPVLMVVFLRRGNAVGILGNCVGISVGEVGCQIYKLRTDRIL